MPTENPQSMEELLHKKWKNHSAGLLREQPVWRENYFINDACFEALAR